LQKEKIGEVWFEPGNDLLVKFLYAEQDLSVQVHPNDEQARQVGQDRGKTEMWHVLSCDPGAKIAFGLRETVTMDKLRSAIQKNSLESLLRYVPVQPGDTFFIPAGTIHAIGGGIRLCEIQQHSDVTYRLYDYGRGRQLHVEEGLAVSQLTPTDSHFALPVTCEYFHVEEVKGGVVNSSGEDLLIVLEGGGHAGDEPIQAGQVWKLGAGKLALRGAFRALHAALPL